MKEGANATREQRLAADEALMLHYGRACEPCEHAATLRCANVLDVS